MHFEEIKVALTVENSREQLYMDTRVRSFFGAILSLTHINYVSAGNENI